ncbi:MAG: hypothetical protein DRJ41_04775 [Thermoprotei archaeon]|nr:MAG: hypothetical protein DRJ41_04775 [Thermoprotei archaeon]
MVKNVWMLAHESKGVYKVGGLGEVVYSLSRELVRQGLNVAVVMPSHGLERSVTSLELAKEVDNGRVAVYRTALDGVSFFLVSGLGEREGILNSPVVYGKGITEGKAAVMAREAELIVSSLSKTVGLPDVIHVHDWHSVPLGMAIKRIFDIKGHRAGFLMQIHLLVSKYVSWDYLFDECGLSPDHETLAYTGYSFEKVSYGDAYNRGGGILEKIGAIVFDGLVTVSDSYLRRDEGCVLCSLGREFEGKADYIHNGTEWKYEDVLSYVLSLHKERLFKHLGIDNLEKITRRDLRRYLLTDALKEIPCDQPQIRDEYLRNLVESLKHPIFSSHGRPRPFKEDGPLIITTGRVSTQKGFDVLLRSMPLVLNEIPEARLLMLLLPVRGEEHLITKLADEASRHPDNVRIIYGIAPYIYQLAHLAADVFAAPSRWEPFGIMAIEALSVGVPVVASRLGGLREIVIDLRESPGRGIGLLVPKDDPEELSRALIAMLALMNPEQHKERLAKQYLHLAQLPEPEKLRLRCIKRVDESFRWSNSAMKTVKIYEKMTGAVRTHS